MSMPTFPDINPDITCNSALNMILTSIALEELALSHIMNAEGEKLQYVLGTLKASGGMNPTINEILAVNKSVASILDTVSQNEMILKNKMEKTLQALSERCPPPVNPTKPADPRCFFHPRCSAIFKGMNNGERWCADSGLPWNEEYQYGKCVCCDSCDNTKINLCSKGRFMVSFTANVRVRACSECGIAICLQRLEEERISDIFTIHESIPCADNVITVSMCGIMLEVSKHCRPSSLFLKLLSPERLSVDCAILSIVEI